MASVGLEMEVLAELWNNSLIFFTKQASLSGLFPPKQMTYVL